MSKFKVGNKVFYKNNGSLELCTVIDVIDNLCIIQNSSIERSIHESDLIAPKFQIGDKVKVWNKEKSDTSISPTYTRDMTAFRNKISVITDIRMNVNKPVYILALHNYYSWAEQTLSEVISIDPIVTGVTVNNNKIVVDLSDNAFKNIADRVIITTKENIYENENQLQRKEVPLGGGSIEERVGVYGKRHQTSIRVRNQCNTTRFVKSKDAVG